MSFRLAGTILTHQPSRVQVIYPGARERALADGGRVVIEPSGKRRIRVTWGVRGTSREAIKELRDMRTSAVVSLTFDDVDGTETTISQVYFPQVGSDTPPGGDANAFRNPLTLEFLEL